LRQHTVAAGILPGGQQVHLLGEPALPIIICGKPENATISPCNHSNPMAKNSRPKKTDYEDLAATYQVSEIALLNSVLKASGISDRRKRRKICEEFIFSQGVILDEGAFQTKGQWYRAVLSYVELRGNPDKGFRKTKEHFQPTDRFTGYHEYAMGNLAYFFEDCDEKTDFDWGPEYD
jgi:hypothetical protein